METVLEDKSLLVFALLYFSTAFYKGFLLKSALNNYMDCSVACLKIFKIPQMS
jgi:hypothetical protein